MPRIVLFTESAPSPVCRPIAHENAKCGQFFSCILNETGVYYCQRAMRYFGPEYMPSEAVFKLISLAKFRGILRLKPGFRHRGFESSTLRHFYFKSTLTIRLLLYLLQKSCMSNFVSIKKRTPPRDRLRRGRQPRDHFFPALLAVGESCLQVEG